jgi:hypothetical protein
MMIETQGQDYGMVSLRKLASQSKECEDGFHQKIVKLV